MWAKVARRSLAGTSRFTSPASSMRAIRRVDAAAGQQQVVSKLAHPAAGLGAHEQLREHLEPRQGEPCLGLELSVGALEAGACWPGPSRTTP